MNWIAANKEWLFSGVGVTVALVLLTQLRHVFIPENKKDGSINIINNINDGHKMEDVMTDKSVIDQPDEQIINDLKNNINILFVDDDTRFKVVKIIKNAGWKNARIVNDIANIDGDDAQWADIYFIDIKGVGVAMSFHDEGLGLAEALKTRYPNKGLVIYSSDQDGDRFHKALNISDVNLRKNADPYEFQRTVEVLAKMVNKNK